MEFKTELIVIHHPIIQLMASLRNKMCLAFSSRRHKLFGSWSGRLGRDSVFILEHRQRKHRSMYLLRGAFNRGTGHGGTMLIYCFKSRPDVKQKIIKIKRTCNYLASHFPPKGKTILSHFLIFRIKIWSRVFQKIRSSSNQSHICIFF